MIADEPGDDGRAEALRRAFDETFVRPLQERTQAGEGFLAIGISGDPFAVRLTEIVEIYKDRRVVPMPSPRRDFLGLAGLRRGITTVYSLRGLMGYPVSREKESWLFLAAPGHSIAFAVDRIEGHLRVDPTNILSAVAGGNGHLSAVVRSADTHRPVISLRSLRESLGARETVPDS